MSQAKFVVSREGISSSFQTRAALRGPHLRGFLDMQSQLFRGAAALTLVLTGGEAMPRQNRVTPFGEIVATPERGAFLGNRGVLHDRAGNIRRAWQVERWLLCLRLNRR